MKVLYQTNIPNPYVVDFFNLLGKKCELTVLYERHFAKDRDKKWVGGSAKNYKEIYLRGKNIGSENSFCPSIIKYIKGDYDHIIIGDYSTYTAMWAIRYMRRHKIPYILSTDGGFANYEESNIKKRLKTYLIGGASKWLSPGGLSNEYLIHYGAVAERITEYPFTSLGEEDILSSPIELEEKKKIRESLGINCDVMIIGVGQFIYRKGWDVLASALKAGLFDTSKETHLDIQAYIIGGEKEKLEELVGMLPKNLHAIPFVSKKELFEYYKAADIFALPTREDIWGLVVNEAMACGLPVITTDRCNAGISLVEDNVNGYIVPKDDEVKLKEAVERLAYDDNLREEMSRHNLEKILKYTYQNKVESYISAL
ncbi:MAG: glycosyltransferase family 4 protein [Lachnospiraceae bacterium]|nr:glycosyltransferase family 4 protein [Lachnospiraceae bacterium]